MLATEANAPERLGAAVILHEVGNELAQTEVVCLGQGYGGENFARVVKQICSLIRLMTRGLAA